MRTASILLALVVVLGFVSQASAADYRIWVRGRGYGIYDWKFEFKGKVFGQGGTAVDLGFSHFDVPFTATQGLIGFCVIVVGLLALVTVFTFRWKCKRATQ
jgi:uncharacterized membrane protein (UPF0182 family)